MRALGPLGLGVGTGPSTVPFAFSWADGTTNPTASATRSGLQHNNTTSSLVPGYGFSFTVPATGSAQRLKVWVSAHHGTGILTATVGAFDPVTNAAISGGQNHGGVYTIDFTGDGTPGQVLTVSWVLQQAVTPTSTLDSDGLPSTEANVVIYAAALDSELVTNGSFEQPTTTNPDFDDIAAPSSAITGWSVSSGTVDHIRTHWVAAAGSQSIDLEGNSPGTIEQTFPTTPGADYRLTFQYSANPDGGPAQSADRTADVLVNGLTVDTVSHAQSPFVWQAESLVIHATSASTTLAFHSTASTPSYGIAIDAVSVVPIVSPPATVGAPTLTGIYHVGSDTYYAGHMAADPNTAYDLTFASSATCPGAVMAPGSGDLRHDDDQHARRKRHVLLPWEAHRERAGRPERRGADQRPRRLALRLLSVRGRRAGQRHVAACLPDLVVRPLRTPRWAPHPVTSTSRGESAGTSSRCSPAPRSRSR